MATTYYSENCKSGYGYSPRAGLGVCSKTVVFETTAALVINDVIQMVKIPKGATILDVKLGVDDIDSGSSLTLSVGDGTTPGRFILESTIGQGGGVVGIGTGITGASAADVLGYTYAADDTIDIKVIAAPAGDGEGTLTLSVLYTMDE